MRYPRRVKLPLASLLVNKIKLNEKNELHMIILIDNNAYCPILILSYLYYYICAKKNYLC